MDRTSPLTVDEILAEARPDWCAYGYDDGSTRPPSHVLARARALFEAGQVHLVQRRERDRLAYLMRVRIDPAPLEIRPKKKPEPVMRGGPRCAVPSCRSVLAPGNQSGVCRSHNHVPGYCRCRLCARRAVDEDDRPPVRTWTDEQVVAMRRLWRGGATYPEIGEAFGARESLVAKAVSGRTYRHVPGAVTNSERRARYGQKGRRG